MTTIKKLLFIALAVVMAFGTLAGCKITPDKPPDKPPVYPPPTESPIDPITGFPKDPGTRETLKINAITWDAVSAIPLGFQEVLDYYHANYADKLGIDLEFKFNTYGELTTRLDLDIAAKTADYDITFDSTWIRLNEFAKGSGEGSYYYDLKDDFAMWYYTGLQRAFTDDYKKLNYVAGGLYGVPQNDAAFGAMAVVYLRKDWRERAAQDTSWTIPSSILAPDGTATKKKMSDLADGIDDHEEFQLYLYWVKDRAGTSWTANGKNYSIPAGVVPYGMDNTGAYGAYNVIATQDKPSPTFQQFVDAGIKPDILLNSSPTLVGTAYINRDEVVAAGIQYERPGAPNGQSDNYPQGFTEQNPLWQKYYNEMRRWFTDGIISANVQALESPAGEQAFKGGNAAAFSQTLNGFESCESAVRQSTDTGEVEVYIFNPTERDKDKGTVFTDFKVWNHLAVPISTTKAKKDKFVLLLNWLCTKQEYYDLFCYGIKGKHWEEVKDGAGNPIPMSVSTIGMEAYGFEPYNLCWNATFSRAKYASDAKVMEYRVWEAATERFIGKPYPEFVFDKSGATKSVTSAALEDAFTNPDIAAAFNAFTSYQLGVKDNPVAEWNAHVNAQNTNAKLQADLDTIRKSLMEQLQKYIDDLAEAE